MNAVAVQLTQESSAFFSSSFQHFLDQASADPVGFRKTWSTEVAHTKKTLRHLNRGVLNPRSTLIHYWDLLTAGALVFTAIVTPFEVCFLYMPVQPESAAQWALLLLNQVVNAIFVGDIGVNFFLPYPVEGGYERSHKKIIARYVRSGWLALDLVSVFPFDLLAISGLLDAMVASGSSDGTNLKFLIRIPRTAKLLRLVKLVRMLKASRIISRWQSKISFTHATKIVLKWFLLILWGMHMFACIWALLPQMMGSQPALSLASAAAVAASALQR